MFFVQLMQRRSAHQDVPTVVRGDHILQMNPLIRDGAEVGTWMLIQHTGWFAASNPMDEVIALVREAQTSAPANKEGT